MLVLTGSSSRTTHVTAGLDQAWDVVENFVDVFAKLPDVDTVERYPQDVVRVILKRIGAMGYGVHLAYDLQFHFEPQSRLIARSLPFDPQDAWIGDGILLAQYYSETRLVPQAEGTALEHAMDVEVQLPMPSILRFAPQNVVKATGDALMEQKLAYFTDQMARLFRESLA
ncbi:hypothetical protein D3C87_485260 [compost metagenome]